MKYTKFLNRKKVDEQKSALTLEVNRTEKTNLEKRMKAGGILGAAAMFGSMVLQATAFPRKEQMDTYDNVEDMDGGVSLYDLVCEDESLLAEANIPVELNMDDGSEDLADINPEMETITVFTDAPFYSGNLGDYSFSEAFSRAREELGAGGFFEYRGDIYNTYYREEWDSLGLEGQDEYMASLDIINADFVNETPVEDIAGIDVQGAGLDVTVTNVNPMKEGADPFIFSEDRNNDGIVDVTHIDGNADGFVDASIYNNNNPDLDGDIDVDIVAVDTNSDQIIEIVHIDGNSDNTMDVSVVNNSIVETPEPITMENEIDDFDMEADIANETDLDNEVDLDLGDLADNF